MTLNDKIKYLSTPLPEDIQSCIQSGFFDQAISLIDSRLASGCPEALQGRLELEKIRLIHLPEDFPYSYPQALALIRDTIPSFTEEEFRTLETAGRIDFIFLNGEKRYFHRFFETLTATHPDIAARSNPALAAESARTAEFRRETIRQLKEKGSLQYHIHIQAGLEVKEGYFRPGREMVVHLPVPKEEYPSSNVRILRTSHIPSSLEPVHAPARTVSFREKLMENEGFWVEYEYDSTIRYQQSDPALVSSEQPDFEIQELLPHIQFTPFLRSLAADIIGEETNPLEKARRIYDYITTTIKYSYMKEYFMLQCIPEYCAVNRKGDCGVQALLFITLCRIAGIPARWQSGLSATPDSIGPHDWAQFYIAPFGWLHADLSFGGSAFRAGDEERRRFYFCNLDPFRMVANTEFQAPLSPVKQGLRADPYDNQVGECEIDGIGLYGTQFDYYHKMIDIHPIP